MEVIFPATDEALADVNSFVETRLEEAGCSPKNQMKIMIALEELFVNVAHYAYSGADAQSGHDGQNVQDGKVAIDLDFEGGDMILSLKDSGRPFNPLEKADPDVTLSAEERNIGGLGIFMVKKSMDEVSYRYEEGCNIITIRHQIN